MMILWEVHINQWEVSTIQWEVHEKKISRKFLETFSRNFLRNFLFTTLLSGLSWLHGLQQGRPFTPTLLQFMMASRALWWIGYISMSIIVRNLWGMSFIEETSTSFIRIELRDCGNTSNHLYGPHNLPIFWMNK